MLSFWDSNISLYLELSKCSLNHGIRLEIGSNLTEPPTPTSPVAYSRRVCLINKQLLSKLWLFYNVFNK